MTSEAYERSVALKAAVLRHIRDTGGSIGGYALVASVGQYCRKVREKDPHFDFVFTLKCTIYDLMDWMYQTGFVTIDDDRPSLTWEYGRMNLTLTEHGASFITTVEREIDPKITQLFK